jgi:chromosome partitioning protein
VEVAATAKEQSVVTSIEADGASPTSGAPAALTSPVTMDPAGGYDSAASPEQSTEQRGLDESSTETPTASPGGRADSQTLPTNRPTETEAPAPSESTIPETPADSVPSSENMALPQPEVVEGIPRDQVWGQDRLGKQGKDVAALNELIEAVTMTMTASDGDQQAAGAGEPAAEGSGQELGTTRVLTQTSPSSAPEVLEVAELAPAHEDPDLMEELPSDRPVPADAIKRASEALDAAVNAAPAVLGPTSDLEDDEMVRYVDGEFTHFDGESELESEPEEVASDYSVRVTDPIPVQSLSAPGVSRETSGSVQMPHGTQQPTGGPHGGDDERRSALIATVPAVDDTTPVAAELAMDARRRIELQGRRFPRPPKTRIITVANQKGGVGKTTTTVNVAAGLAQSGLNVLVIDNDPQGNASTALGIEHRAGTPSVYEILVEGESLASTVQQCPDIPNLWGVPATIDLSGSEIELVSLVSRETRLRKAIDKYLADRLAAGEERIDYVLIDCPPSLGLLTVNAFVAGREVFIPIQCEYYALEGLSQLLKTIDLIRSHLNPELRVSSILLTMYDGRTNLAQQVAGEVRSHFPAETFKTTIPRSVRISEAPSYGQTVMTYDATSTGALAYLQASRELAERGQGGSSPRRAMKAEAVGAQD